jgi:transposase-like protein
LCIHKRSHLRSVTERRYTCEICRKTFVERVMYNIHRRRCGSKQYTCNLCDRTFWHEYSLQLHMKVRFSSGASKILFLKINKTACKDNYIRYNDIFIFISSYLSLWTFSTVTFESLKDIFGNQMCLNTSVTWYLLTVIYVVVKALCYKPEGRGFDTRWGDFFFNLPSSSRPWASLSP